MNETEPRDLPGGVALSYDDLRARISERHAGFSKRLRQVAEFALTNPNDVALETVATLADRAGVQPSTLIRFAKAMGFDGFSDMQRVFQMRLVDRYPSYSERIRALSSADGPGPDGSKAVLDHFVAAGMHALEHLGGEVGTEALDRAVDLLARANDVYIMGTRRAFSVAAYLEYTLSHLGRRTRLVDGHGGMTTLQARNMAGKDVLIAISFKPYAPETMEICRRASDHGTPIVALTDGPLSPLVPLATVAFEIEDARVHGFRALTATMCLAVSLVVSLGQALENRRTGTS